MATLQLTDDRKTRKFTVRAERYRGRLRIGFGQVRLDTRNLREGWQAMLKDLLGDLVG